MFRIFFIVRVFLWVLMGFYSGMFLEKHFNVTTVQRKTSVMGVEGMWWMFKKLILGMKVYMLIESVK